jgi:muramidase (phage lysozyme)
MGGKTSQSTSTVSIPPEVLARYNAVNARAEEVAQTPFQQYGGQFVAGLTPTQQAGIQNTSAAASQAQPYYGAATGLALAGTMPVSPGALQTGQYMNPFTQAVAAPTYQALRQQQGQERAQQQAQAIKSGAFGGDRAGLERANLARQQELGTAQAIAPIFQQGYQQALGTAQQQQGVNLAAEQANRAAFQQGAQQIAGLGTGAQQAALQGAQAQLAAGTAEQQTNQADLTARYQQFLQERGYPFQTAQFLANIAMGTGALSGSTTTSTQPAGFFSDERLKEDIHRVGETDDGLPIYSYRYKGDKKTQIGLIAQDVEKEKPEAVGLAPAADGKLYKTVDYKKATEDKPHKAYGGGLDVNSMGGSVFEPGHFAGGGMADPNDMQSILAAIGQPIPAYGNKSVLGGGPIGAAGVVPLGGVHVSRLPTAQPGVIGQQKSGLAQITDASKGANDLYKTGKAGLIGSAPTKDDPEGSAGLIGGQGKMSGKNIFSEVGDFFKSKEAAAHGGLIVGRHHYDDGGFADGEDNKDDANEDRARVPSSALPSDVLKSGSQHGNLAVAGGRGGSGPQSGLSQLTQGINAVKGIGDLFGEDGAMSGAGDFLSTIGEAFLASGGAANGPGLIVRQHHKDGERVVADDATGVVPADDTSDSDTPRYKIEPQKREEMEPHWQDFIKDIYSREGGLDSQGNPRYNVRQGTGKETFDIEKGHPGLKPAPGGESSASGAGQFINSTWNRVTGGAPMTEGYQDAATKALAIDDYRRRTGRDLDADLREKGFTPDIRAALAPTWTSLYGKGDRPAAGAREAQYQAEPQESGLSLKSIGDTVTSDKFLVPFLSFVGSTLASQRPTLGGALGEGIVGGVSGYQQNKKVQAELAKGVLDIVKDRFNITNDPKTGKPVYYNKADGRLISPAEYAQAVGGIADSLGVPRGVLGISTAGIDLPKTGSGITQPGEFSRPGVSAPPGSAEAAKAGAAPAGATGAPDPEVQSVTKTANAGLPEDKLNWNPLQWDEYASRNKEKYGLVRDRDPDLMKQQEAEYLRNATTLRNQGKDAEASAQEKLALDIRGKRDQYIRDAVRQEIDSNKELQTAKNASSSEYMKKAETQVQSYQQDRQAMVRLANIYRDYRAGRLSDIRAAIGDWAGTFNIPLPQKFFDTASNDEAVKIATAEAIDMVGERQLGRAPKAGITTGMLTVPDPKMAPGAAFALIGRTIGEMDYNNDRNMSYIDKGYGASPAKHVADWSRSKNINDYYKNAYGSIPEPDGMLERQRKSLVETYGYKPKARATVEEGAKAPQGEQQSAPAAPVQVKSIDEARKLPSGTVFTDPNGVVRRVP